MKIVEKVRNAISQIFNPTAFLLEERAEWEQQRIDALNGEFDNNAQALKDANEELEEICKILSRRGTA